MSEATTATTTTATALTISQTRTIEPRHGRFSELRQKWHVIVGGMILLMIEGGLRPSLGIYLRYWVDAFDCTQSSAATFFAVMNSACFISGPLTGLLYQLHGARISVIIGTFIATISCAFIGFSTNIYHVIVLALPIGFGSGIIRTAAVAVQCDYFSVQHRNLAMAVAFVGPGIGTFVFPHILSLLIDAYTWRGSWLIISAIFAQCFIIGALFRRRKTTNSDDAKSNVDNKPRFWQHFAVRLFANGDFVAQGVAVFFGAGCAFIYYALIMSLMLDRDLTKNQAVTAFSLHGIFSLIGRFLGTAIIHTNYIGIQWLMVGSYLTAQIPMFSSVFCTDYTQFSIDNSLSGLGNGLFSVVMAPYLVQVGGAKNIAVALGYTNMLNGFGGLLMLQLAGKITDFYSIDYAFYIAVIIGIISIVFSAIAGVIISIKDKRQSQI